MGVSIVPAQLENGRVQEGPVGQIDRVHDWQDCQEGGGSDWPGPLKQTCISPLFGVFQPVLSTSTGRSSTCKTGNTYTHSLISGMYGLYDNDMYCLWLCSYCTVLARLVST